MPENSVHSMESRLTSTSLQLKEEDVKKEEPKEEPEDAPSEGLDDSDIVEKQPKQMPVFC